LQNRLRDESIDRLNDSTMEFVKMRALFGKGRNFWTHPSVLLLSVGDPVEYISSRASKIALEAMEHGWSGPPYDPAKLAEHLRVCMVPTEEVADARTVPLANDRLQIEFNPNKPKARVRFSIAHELGHSLFPDCHETIRHRHPVSEQQGDEWQVEMLCNLAAAEFLMPMGSFPDFKQEAVSIDRLLELRRQFEVSTETVLLRVVRLTEFPCAMFVASKHARGVHPDRFTLDYTVGSRRWKLAVRSGSLLPKNSAMNECTAIGYTAKGDEEWGAAGKLHLECVGVAPFPGERFPRVVGIVQPHSEIKTEPVRFRFLAGDATEPRGGGHRVVAHVVNDKTPNWGAGFGLAVREKWPEVQDAFRAWVASTPDMLQLGNVYHHKVNNDTTFLQLICQHGYGPSPTPRLRYGALKVCLDQLANFALDSQATVHMPRIGAGQGGGAWGLIQQLIDETLCARGIQVTIYDLPQTGLDSPAPRELALFG